MNITQKTKGSYDVNNQKAHQAAVAERPVVQRRPIKTCVAYRYYIVVLGFLVSCLPNAQRISVAIAVVDMSNYTSPVQQNESTASCPAFNDSKQKSSNSKMGGDFDWDAEVQGYIISATYLGSVIVQLPGGVLADAIGAKWILCFGNAVCGFVMLISPLLSWWHVYSLIAAHFVRSLAHGVTGPSVFKLISNWAPRRERALISSLILSGFTVGGLLGGIVPGYLCELIGWQSVFYFFGGVGCLFSIQLGLSYYETPEDHPRISETELKYYIEDQADWKPKKKLPTPWVKMFTSVHTYALTYAQFGVAWPIYYFFTAHPAYLSTILHFPIGQNGLFSSLPCVLQFATLLLAGSISDLLYRRKIVGVNKLRKGCNVVGCLCFSLSCLGIYLSGCSKLGNILFLTTATLSCGFGMAGSNITAVDMAPNFSGTLTGIVTTAFYVPGFIIPIMVGYLTKDQTMENWHTVLLVNVAVVMSSGIVFAIFGSAEVQPWNFVEEKVNLSRRESPMEGTPAEEDGNVTEIQIKYIQPK